jgi:hypothetical protein
MEGLERGQGEKWIGTTRKQKDKEGEEMFSYHGGEPVGRRRVGVAAAVRRE